MKKILTFKYIQRILIIMTMIIFFGVKYSDSFAQTGWFSQSSETNQHLTSVYFVNSNTGWVVGDNGLILKTTNGGTNWLQQPSEALNKLFSVYFIDVNTGWFVGYASTICKTTNSGANWLTQAGIPAWVLLSVHFTDGSTGWAVGDRIINTTNGGTNWFLQSSVTYNVLWSVYFTDGNTGWAVGDGGTILNTTNGGTNWSTQASGTGIQLHSVYFTDSDTGWAVGRFGTILKTIDGGANWLSQSSGTSNTLADVYFTGSNGWAVGLDGTIVSTTNSGTDWKTQTRGTPYWLSDVHFTDNSTGWTVGDYGTILKTTTGGNPIPPVPFCGPGAHFVDYCSAGTDSLDIAHNCETQAMIRISFDTSDNCNVLSMPLPVFTGPTIVRRSDPKDTSGRFPGAAQSDGHNDIIETEFVSMDLRSFVVSASGDTAFLKITAGTGNAAGPCRDSLSPSFGYIHELPAYNFSAESFFDVFFELCIKDPYGVIGPPNPEYYLYNLTPVRMGATIDQIPPKCGIDPITNENYTVYRSELNTCSKLYASCIPGLYYPPIAKVVHVDHALPVELASFTSSVTGNNVTLNWSTLSEFNNAGFGIEKNEGNDWKNVGFVKGQGSVNTTSQYEFTMSNLTSGRYQYRLKQIDFNGSYEYFNLTEFVTIGVPDKFYLGQNYPNPFNPFTTIAYDIPEAGNVKLKVFDVSGREVKTIVNEFKNAGYYTVKFDAVGLASGVYFYRIEIADFVTVKKMIILK